MSQNMKFNAKGVDAFMIGKNIEETKSLILIQNNSINGERVNFFYNDSFCYYYLASKDNMLLEGQAEITNFIVAADKTGIIVGLFVFIKSNDFKLENIMDINFGDNKYTASSHFDSINIQGVSSWYTTDNIHILLRKKSINGESRISLVKKKHYDEKEPGVTIFKN
jgi:hypothetical protein